MANPPRSFDICQTRTDSRRELGSSYRDHFRIPLKEGHWGDWIVREELFIVSLEAIQNAGEHIREENIPAIKKDPSVIVIQTKIRGRATYQAKATHPFHQPMSQSLASLVRVNPTANPQITYSHRPRRSRWTSFEPSASRALRSGRLASMIGEIPMKTMNRTSEDIGEDKKGMRE